MTMQPATSQIEGQEEPVQGAGPGHANARSAIIDALRAAGSISRTEIVSATRLTGATVSIEIRSLIDEGLVVEDGTAPSTGGRARVLLRLAEKSRYAIGFHLDHDGVTTVLLDISGDVVAEHRDRYAHAEDPSRVVEAMAAQVRGFASHAGVGRDRILGVGLVQPGPATPGEGIVLSRPAMKQWVRFPLAQRLREAVDLPVVVDNDASAAALGEVWTGGARGSAAFSALYMATGIGSGTVVDGVPYRGVTNGVGEVGHVCVDLDGPPCWCGQSGCIEAIAGPSAVVDEARAAGLDVGTDGLTVVEQFAQVVTAARAGDPVAVGIVERSAEHLAVAGQMLASVMAVDLLVLTGPAFDIAGDLYLPHVQARLDRSLVAYGAEVRVEVSEHAHRAAAVGAAALVLQDRLTPRQFSTRTDLGKRHSRRPAAAH